MLNFFLDTPGPGSYILPSDFGYLEQPQKSPRGLTASTLTRPRLAFKSQLSTMTGAPPNDRLSDFASTTDRHPQGSLTMTEKKNKSVMQEMKGAHNLDALHMDSIEINNQLTTRE